ncbi:MAG: glycoside hydrolase family 9 protein [Bacteroidales bacterium]|nr:glycoside hydrolase family 9 protein [Bacteroidales bacterium]
MNSKTKMILSALALSAAFSLNAGAQDLKINDLEYFEAQGVNVLAYSNLFTGGFNDEKNSGIELIHHGVRTAQGGAIRLSTAPEQWDLVPATPSRVVNKTNNTVDISLRYEDYDFDSKIVVAAKGKGIEISVYLDKPVPSFLEGKAGFNLEFLPAEYWNKAFIVDGRLDRFPKYATSATVTKPNDQKVKQYKGYNTSDDRGTGRFIDPLPLETGRSFILAPDDPERLVKISSVDSDISLYDGRILAQNGWFVARTILPAGKTGKVMTWYLEPNQIKGWVRQPNIGFSQVGYTTSQPKISIIELDKVDKVQSKASLVRVKNDGTTEVAYTGKVKTWGRYYKYNYVQFDFSSVKTPGIYYIQYGSTKTNNFLIDDSVYNKITDATTDVWVPIHMNHMFVNEAYRVWHGEPFKEGYLQAPENTDHFDLHSQGVRDVPYADLELIPGLNVGGYFDAGDFDIETGSNINVVQSLIRTWDLFHPMRDETFVDEDQRYVDLHRPDGKPDLLQYIEHGLLNLIAQAEIIGHMSQTLSNAVLDNYHHLGDAASITDGLPYNPALGPYEVAADGKSSGRKDDMWAFTTRNPNTDINAANMFAAASRVMKGYNDDLAERALIQSKRLMEEATAILASRPSRPNQFGGNSNSRAGGNNVGATLQLYLSTGDAQYKEQFLNDVWQTLEFGVNRSLPTALDAVPYMGEDYKEKLRPYIVKYKEYIESLEQNNPYGVPIGLGNWAGSGEVVTFGTTVCYAYLYFPDIIEERHIYKAPNYLYGAHPYHNYSLVAVVGATRPKNVFYGNNRADFSAIPGNVAPGLLFRHPDHFENYDNWPFFWGQNEGTIAGNCNYVIFGSIFKNVSKK